MSKVGCFFMFLMVFASSNADPFSTVVSGVGKMFCATGMMECCDDRWIKLDTQGLRNDLKTKLHGQHLVTPIIANSIGAHVKDKNPKKPLVLSFHGWTGGGKSFVSQMIVNNLYEKGESSNFVHIWHSDLHFKNVDKVQEYKDRLQSWIYHNVSSCGRSIFIFEGMEYMPAGMIDVLIPFLGHNTNVNRVDFRKNIFIFISNVGGDVITKAAFDQRKSGKLLREDLKLRELQNPLEETAKKMLSGLKGSDILEKQLIDHFIPFLPLDRTHVGECVKDEFKRAGVMYTKQDIEQVLEELDWWPRNEKIYSVSGCTKVTHKTRLIHGL